MLPYDLQILSLQQEYSTLGRNVYDNSAGFPAIGKTKQTKGGTDP